MYLQPFVKPDFRLGQMILRLRHERIYPGQVILQIRVGERICKGEVGGRFRIFQGSELEAEGEDIVLRGKDRLVVDPFPLIATGENPADRCHSLTVHLRLFVQVDNVQSDQAEGCSAPDSEVKPRPVGIFKLRPAAIRIRPDIELVIGELDLIRFQSLLHVPVVSASTPASGILLRLGVRRLRQRLCKTH